MVMILMFFSSTELSTCPAWERRSVHDLYSVAETAGVFVTWVVSYIIELQQTEQFITRHQLPQPPSEPKSSLWSKDTAQYWGEKCERNVFNVLYRRIVCSMLPVSNIWHRALHHHQDCSMFLFIVFVFNFLIWRDRIHSAQSWRCHHFVSPAREERGERRETDYNYQFGSLPGQTILVIKLANYIDKAWQGGKSRNVCQFWPLFFSASGKSLLLKDKKYLRTNIWVVSQIELWNFLVPLAEVLQKIVCYFSRHLQV